MAGLARPALALLLCAATADAHGAMLTPTPRNAIDAVLPRWRNATDGKPLTPSTGVIEPLSVGCVNGTDDCAPGQVRALTFVSETFVLTFCARVLLRWCAFFALMFDSIFARLSLSSGSARGVPPAVKAATATARGSSCFSLSPRVCWCVSCAFPLIFAGRAASPTGTTAPPSARRRTYPGECVCHKRSHHRGSLKGCVTVSYAFAVLRSKISRYCIFSLYLPRSRYKPLISDPKYRSANRNATSGSPDGAHFLHFILKFPLIYGSFLCDEMHFITQKIVMH